jgi:hypothetical protein
MSRVATGRRRACADLVWSYASHTAGMVVYPRVSTCTKPDLAVLNPRLAECREALLRTHPSCARTAILRVPVTLANKRSEPAPNRPGGVDYLAHSVWSRFRGFTAVRFTLWILSRIGR